VVSRTWSQLRSCAQLERWREDREGFIVVLDDPTVSHFHHPRCGDVVEQHFETKMASGWSTGAYYWIDDMSQAAGYASACGSCGGRAPA